MSLLPVIGNQLPGFFQQYGPDLSLNILCTALIQYFRIDTSQWLQLKIQKVVYIQPAGLVFRIIMAVLLLPDSTIHMTLFGQKFTPQIVTVAAYQGIIE